MKITSLAFVLCCAALLLSPYKSAAGESNTGSEKAIVKNGPLQVHSGPSARSKVVKSLSKGVAVTVDVEVETSSGPWCGISEQGISSFSGYVPCDSLDQKKTAPVAWKSTGPKSASNPSRSPGSRSMSTLRPYSDITALLYMTTW
jgi:uncharacterized protein YgiM (DUF1202 family)